MKRKSKGPGTKQLDLTPGANLSADEVIELRMMVREFSEQDLIETVKENGEAWAKAKILAKKAIHAGLSNKWIKALPRGRYRWIAVIELVDNHGEPLFCNIEPDPE